MPAGITVPTIFTAVDKLSATVAKMGKSVGGFAKTAAFGISRLNEKFNGFFKLGDLSKQFLSLASTAAIAALIISGIQFSAKSLLDYDKAIAQLHNTLYTVSGTGFIRFQQAVEQTAKSTDSSTIDIANSFKTIAQLNPELAKTPQSLSLISKAALTLSRATGTELAPSTEGLVGVMNIYKLQAKDATRVINVLAAAQAHGAGDLETQIEAYRSFGIIAKSANLSLEQTAGLQSVFGQMLQKGTLSATSLRTAIIRLQKAGVGYQSGQFNINDALAQTIKFYDKIKNQRGKDDFLIKLFGPRGMSAGRILLDNAQKIGDVTKAVTGTNVAFGMAAGNMNTVYGLLDRIRNKWVTFITSSSDASKGLTQFKDVLRYVINNFDSIIGYAISFVKWFLIIKTAIFALNTGLAIYNALAAATATVTAAIGPAAASSSIVVAGFGSAVSTAAVEIGVADTAATAFFATLSAFVLPASLVALGGLAIWKMVSENQKTQAYGDSLLKPKFYSSKTPDYRFKFSDEEDAYQKWWLNQVKMNPKLPENDPSFQRNIFDKQYGNQYSTNAIFDPAKMRPALLSPAVQSTHTTAATHNNLSIDINDPGGHVKKTTGTGPFPIPVRVSSTTGKQD